MAEILKNDKQNSVNADSLASMPTFDERIAPRTHEQRLQRFMELSGIKEVRANEEEFNGTLKELDFAKAYNVLSHINIILRGEKLHERGRRDNVSVGEHTAPASYVQKKSLETATSALGKIENDRYRAAMSYYVLNGLHMFPDGNGRTSRAVYEIMENPDFDLANVESLKHHETNDSYGHYKFEKEKDIRSANVALNAALWFVKSELIKSGQISEEMKKQQTQLEIIYGTQPEVFLTDEAEQELSSEEKSEVNRAFMDGDVALVALGTMLTKKGVYDEVSEACTRETPEGEKYVAIQVMRESLDISGEENELAAKTFAGWTAEDYREFVKRVGAVQQRQYQHLIRFFEKPEEYKLKDGKLIADWLTERDK